MKFIHLADVHLGAVPDKGESWSSVRGREIWDTFRRAVAFAGEEKADLLLIAGDLFHRQPLKRELKEVNYLFSSIPDTEVIMIAGNHDYLQESSAYLKFTWAENVTCIWEDELTVYELPRLHTWVYGCSYHNREWKEAIYDSLRPGDQKGIHILLAHGGDASHIPMDFARIKSAGFDYVALGHIHKPQILSEHMAYSGALEPLERNETGSHGLIMGEWDQQGKLQLRFVPMAIREYRDLEIPVRPETTQFSLEEQITYEIRQKGATHLYRVILTGRRDAEKRFDLSRLKTLGNITQVEDSSVPDYNFKELMNRYEGTLIGEYIGNFLEKDSMTEVEEMALFYGLQAMLEERL